MKLFFIWLIIFAVINCIVLSIITVLFIAVFREAVIVFGILLLVLVVIEILISSIFVTKNLNKKYQAPKGSLIIVFVVFLVFPSIVSFSYKFIVNSIVSVNESQKLGEKKFDYNTENLIYEGNINDFSFQNNNIVWRADTGGKIDQVINLALLTFNKQTNTSFSEQITNYEKYGEGYSGTYTPIISNNKIYYLEKEKNSNNSLIKVYDISTKTSSVITEGLSFDLLGVANEAIVYTEVEKNMKPGQRKKIYIWDSETNQKKDYYLDWNNESGFSKIIVSDLYVYYIDSNKIINRFDFETKQIKEILNVSNIPKFSGINSTDDNLLAYNLLECESSECVSPNYHIIIWDILNNEQLNDISKPNSAMQPSFTENFQGKIIGKEFIYEEANPKDRNQIQIVKLNLESGVEKIIKTFDLKGQGGEFLLFYWQTDGKLLVYMKDSLTSSKNVKRGLYTFPIQP